MTDSALSHVFAATMANFETEVIAKSTQIPVLLDFWASWCEPCKTLTPVLEKLTEAYNGAFLLAKVDVDAEQQLAAAFQIRSVPTVMLVKGGQLVDAFPGVLPEAELRKFLQHHGIEPAQAQADSAPQAPLDPQQEVAALRQKVEEDADNAEHRLALALALLKIGASKEAEQLLDALPANLATDDRAIAARARLGFAAALDNAPPAQVLEQALAADPNDLTARHLRGAQLMVEGDYQGALEQFITMLRQDRNFNNGLPRQLLIDAFRVIDDAALVSRYRRQMSSLLLA